MDEYNENYSFISVNDIIKELDEYNNGNEYNNIYNSSSIVEY